MGRQREIELIALIDLVDRHQRTLAHLTCHHGVWSRLGKYETDGDGRFFHREAAVLSGNDLKAKISVRRLVSPNCRACHLCCLRKKGAGVALTRPVTLRHNNLLCESVHCGKVLAQPMTSE